jgi:uncharacterized protein (TIGR02302 family)
MVVPERPEDRMEPLLRGLRRRRRLARAALWFEQLWPAIWPALGVAGVLLCLALLDVLPLLPGWAHALTLAAFGVTMLGLLIRGIGRISRPGTTDADRRLERASGLRHRPLETLGDRPAMPGAEALWGAHLARVAGQIGRLRVGLPRPGLARVDRRALRAGLVVALVASFGIAGVQAPARILRALDPSFQPAGAPQALLLQAWITPPGYTGQAPVFLKAEGGGATVPAASHLTLSVSGGSGEPSLRLGGRRLELRRLDTNSWQADADLSEGGRLALARDGRTLAGWDLTVIADQDPVVSFPEAPAATRTRLPQTRIPWQAAHAYGVANLRVEIRLRDRPDAPPLVLPIPLPSLAMKTGRGARVFDLTAHPWAGLPVLAQLMGRSVSGREGHSADASFELPERLFLHPVAKALMELRKGLSVHPEARTPAILALNDISGLEEVWDSDTGGFLTLRDIVQLLRRERDAQAAVDEAQDRMWQLALHLEEGAPERTARALEEARQKLREAMEAEKRGDLADRSEIEKKMRDVQEALRKHLEALAEQAQRDPDSRAYDPRQHDMDVRDMQRLAEEMRDAAKQEKMDSARDKLAELEKMLDEMKNARPERGKLTEHERQRAEKRQKGQQQMSVLQDLVKREGGLLDSAQGRAEAAAPQSFPRLGPPLRRPEPQAVAPANPQTQREAEQKTQRALRRVLGELMQQYGDMMGQVPAQLSEADTAMRDAAAALGQSQDLAAAGQEQKAIEALQKGGRQMGQQMAQQLGSGDDGEGEGEEGGEMEAEGQDGGPGNQAGNQDGPGQGGDARNWSDRGRGRPWGGRGPVDRRADNRRDPLGRVLRDGNAGVDESSDVKVPDEMEQARTRAIQEELRRRSADRQRPQPELDYFDRLLRQF